MNPVLLLIEDDRAQRELLSELLRDAGYLVVSASNALFARAALGTMKPAVIVTDMHMPGLSGGELVAALRRDPRLEAIPVLVIAEDPASGLPPGAQRLLRRPFRPGQLLDAVRGILRPRATG